MSERDKREWRAIKADPVRYAAYLERKRRERASRRDYETKRKANWRAANRERNALVRKAQHAVEAAVKGGKLYKRQSCEKCHVIGKVDAHHFMGYEQKYWLCVMWLCKNCHAKEHHPDEA